RGRRTISTCHRQDQERVMYRAFFLRALSVVSVASTIALGGVIPQFKAVYTLGHGIERGGIVSVPISIRLINQNGADVRNGSLSIESPALNKRPLASLTRVSVDRGNSVRLSGTLSVPRAMYPSVKRGAGLGMLLVLSGPKGRSLRQWVQPVFAHTDQ